MALKRNMEYFCCSFPVSDFLGKRKSSNYEDHAETLLTSFRAPGSNMSVKVYFPHSHLDYFLESQNAISHEQGEEFH